MRISSGCVLPPNFTAPPPPLSPFGQPVAYGVLRWARDQIPAAIVSYTTTVAMLDPLPHCARLETEPAS